MRTWCSGALAALALLGFGCSGQVDAEEPISISEAITNGTVETPWAQNPPAPTAAILYAQQSGSCTATLVSPSWVLTAQHCDFQVGATFTSIRPTGNVSRTADAVVNSRLPVDITMVHLSEPFTDVPTLPVYTGSEPALLNQVATSYGLRWPDGYVLKSAPFKLGPADKYYAQPSDTPYYYTSSKNAAGQVMELGDSGGPLLLNGKVVAVNSTGNGQDMGFATVASNRDLVTTPSRVQFTTGDFNGDGMSDFIATTSAGSKFYFSRPFGRWSIDTRAELTLSSANFTTGDFDGDGKTDLIVSTAGKAEFWYGTVSLPWVVKPAPVLGIFTPGKFNSDKATDFVLATSTETTWYYATATRGVWTKGVVRKDITGISAQFTPGDFDADGSTDLVISTSKGSQWYYAKTGWTKALVNRPDLPVGEVTFVPGDFDGDKRCDLVITNPVGSFWYYAGAVRGQWNDTAYQWRLDLPLGTVRYTTADFNGDGKTDLIITTATGSYWYVSGGLGIWNEGVFPSRPDLRLDNTLYAPGDFNKDGLGDLIISAPTGSYWYYSTGYSWTYPMSDKGLPL